MEAETLKNIFTKLFFLIISILILNNFSFCNHVHDDKCNFNEHTNQCTHIHSEECGYLPSIQWNDKDPKG